MRSKTHIAWSSYEAIEKTGQPALTRVVIGQRERTLALRVMAGGIAAHTPSEQRDMIDARPLFEEAADMQPDPEMVDLAVQLIKRQAGRYDPRDIEDRYETRLRAMIDASSPARAWRKRRLRFRAATSSISWRR